MSESYGNSKRTLWITDFKNSGEERVCVCVCVGGEREREIGEQFNWTEELKEVFKTHLPLSL